MSTVGMGRVQKGIAGEHLYAHFYEEGRNGIEDMIDRKQILINEPTNRERFWAYKLTRI